jgi:ribonuclease BN (tRNA processing enzyme)
MSIRVLGCSGAIAAGCRTTAFLLDESILIDAGTGVGDLTLEELVKIDHICISHSHLDHILSIALLADTVMRRRMAEQRGPITVHALPQTIDALKAHIFNGVIWPDFTKLPSPARPALLFQDFVVGETLQLCGRRLEVLPAAHTVPAVGFAVEGRLGHWVYTGDTGPNIELWRRLAGLSVVQLVIETAFSDEEMTLAQISGHFCPATLAVDLGGLPEHVELFITHVKPGEGRLVMEGLRRHAPLRAFVQLEAGQTMAFD